MSDDAYRPITRRRRLLIVVLALGTAITVLLSLIYRPGSVKPPPPPPNPDAARCSGGQSDNCVGGTADVIMLPASKPAAPAASSPG